MPIYADYAATAPLRASARDAMNAALDLWGNPSSLHASGRNAREALESARATVARLIGAKPSEIIFTSGGSESNTAAIRSAAMLGARAGKHHIISTVIEHPSVQNTLRVLEDEGFEVERLSVTSDGYVKAHQIAAAIRPDTALVTVMYANNEIGTVQSIRDIAATCRERGVLFHTDAVQAVGHIPVNATELATVFANAIENAIHACEKLPPEKRFIEIKVLNKPRFMVMIKNSFDGNVEFDENDIPVNRAEGHGFGTRSIVAFCEKHKTFYRFVAEGDEFTLYLNF